MIHIKRLDIALTTLCNFTCSYCRGNPGERKMIPYKEVVGIIDNFSEFGVKSIRLDGGEPFLYGKDIFNIMEYAGEKGMEVGIFTNASLINEDMAKKLSQLPHVVLYVTLHILNKEHELEATLKGLKEIAKYNIPAELIIIVSKKSMQKLLVSIKKVPDYNYKVIFRPIIPIGKAFDNMDEGYASLNEEDVKEFEGILHEIKAQFGRLEIMNEITNIHQKKDGYHNRKDGFVLHVNTNGELLPSFAAGTSKFLGSALDMDMIKAKLADSKTLDFLLNADKAVLNRINGEELPLQSNINLT
ncbi:MAG: radical SAM protein [Anaerocolumna sp.]